VMQIYDLMHMGEANIKRHIRSHFYNSAHIKDQRIIDMLLEKGYIDLEDTLLQHKQKNHLMLLLEGTIGTDNNLKLLNKDSSEEEQFVRWVH
jgi:NADH dehydrogenase (ubiquinone) 1 alpha subcomplex subunit 6